MKLNIKEYYQKSGVFLVPLVIDKQSKKYVPYLTAIRCTDLNISIRDKKLLIVYRKAHQANFDWNAFEDTLLLNEYLLDTIDDGDKIIYVYDLSPWTEDFEKFLNGNYKDFSKNAKQRIHDYWSTYYNGKYVMPEIFQAWIHPEDFYVEYEHELGLPANSLKGKNLCSIFDMKKETYKLKTKEKNNDTKSKNLETNS